MVARVIEALKADTVQAEIAEKAEAAIQARSEALKAEVDEERESAITAARRKEEERLSELKQLQNILKENASKVAAETLRREEEEKRAKREREAELVRLREEQKRLRTAGGL